jgi:glycosyltransferase involved in cell wall biosynthesis
VVFSTFTGPMPKPRVAYLFSRYPVVSQTFCDSEMLALEERGFELEIGSLNPPPNSFRHERLDRLKAEIHYPPPPELRDEMAKDPAFKELLGEMIADHDERYGTVYKAKTRAKNAWYFAQLFRRLGVHHVHIHFANRATHTALFLKRLGFSFSFTAHAQDFMFDLGRNDLLAEMAREAEFVIAVSDYSKGLLGEICQESAHKVFRIYNGIEVNDFHAVPVRDRQPVRGISIGRLIEFKGFQHLISAAALLKRHGVAVELRVIGEGPIRAELEKRIADENVADVVTLLGMRSQEEVKKELHDADFFVLPSIFDSVGACDILPTVITEAMASSLPVVSTTVAGIPEMVAHGESGLLVEPSDAAALADAIATIAGRPELRRSMGAAGRLRAERLFTFESTARVLGEMFETKVVSGLTHERAVTPYVYLTHEWTGDSWLPEVPSLENGVRWIAESTSSGQASWHAATLARMETLPDANVIESLWLRRAADRARLESERSELGDAIDGRQFYAAARRAVYLAAVLERRDARLLHATRSGAVLTAWMLKRLRPGLKVTAAVEEEPTVPRGVLTRMLRSLDLVSVSDEKVLQSMKGKAEDVLQLHQPFIRRQFKVGPLRFNYRKAAPTVNRAAAEARWLAILKKL